MIRHQIIDFQIIEILIKKYDMNDFLIVEFESSSYKGNIIQMIGVSKNSK